MISPTSVYGEAQMKARILRSNLAQLRNHLINCRSIDRYHYRIAKTAPGFTLAIRGRRASRLRFRQR